MRYSTSGPRLSFLASVPTDGDHVDEIHKTQKEWNGAGTFGSLVTLKKMNDLKNAAEGVRGLSMTH
jgi:hypothetical protein